MKPDDSVEQNPSENQDLTALDRRLRRDRLAQQIRDLGGVVGGLQPEPTDIELEFLERIVAFEIGPFSTHRDWLARHGATFMPPAELDDASLARELWRLLESLARARVFFHCTDHLEDRPFYEFIWQEVLPEKCPDFIRTPADANRWDMADPSADGGAVWLRYYASKAERRDWQREFPNTALPPRSRLPRRRDHRLPTPEDS